MNEQAPAKPEQESLPKAPLATGGGIAAIVPQDIDQAYRLATIIVHADMAPKAYEKDANKVMVGIMHGMELGLTPMASLQSIAVINGMPSVWGDGALALVKRSGLLEGFKETLEGEGDQMKAVCVARRKGDVDEYRNEFSVSDAKKANLYGKSGPWSNYPKRMLKMRARSWTLRDGFADVLRGMTLAEEAMDIEHLEAGVNGSYAPTQRPKRSDYSDAEVQTEASGPVESEQEVEHLFDIIDEVGDILTIGDAQQANVRPGAFVTEYCLHLKRLATLEAIETFIENNEDAIGEILEKGLVDDGAGILADAQQKARERFAEMKTDKASDDPDAVPDAPAEDAAVCGWVVHYPSGVERASQLTGYIGNCRAMLNRCNTAADYLGFLEDNGAQMEDAAKRYSLGQLNEMLAEARANAR